MVDMTNHTMYAAWKRKSCEPEIWTWQQLHWEELTITPDVLHLPVGAAIVQHIEAACTWNNNNLDSKIG
jgi:hypothetical protein